MVKLTRYLYCEDEVKASLISSLLKRTGVQECYYWLSELYYTGTNVFDIIWEIYIDYYALENLHLESYIIKKQSSWEKDNNEEHLCTIIKNLYISQANATVFVLRQVCLSDDLSPSHILKGRPKNWLVKYNKEYRDLLYFFHVNNWNNVCYQLVNLIDVKNKSFNEVFGIIYEYCLNELSNLKQYDIILKTIKKIWEEKICKNYLHYLILILCFIKKICKEDKDKDKEGEQNTENEEKHLYVLPNKTDIDFFKKTNLVSETIKPRNVLLNKRLYYIDSTIGCFNLERFHWNNHDEFKNEMLINWEYYATLTNIWKKRVEKYKINFNTTERKIIFENESEEEDFFDKYNFEPDEQCKELQECAVLDLKRYFCKDWIIINKLEIDQDIIIPDELIVN